MPKASSCGVEVAAVPHLQFGGGLRATMPLRPWGFSSHEPDGVVGFQMQLFQQHLMFRTRNRRGTEMARFAKATITRGERPFCALKLSSPKARSRASRVSSWTDPR